MRREKAASAVDRENVDGARMGGLDRLEAYATLASQEGVVHPIRYLIVRHLADDVDGAASSGGFWFGCE